MPYGGGMELNDRALSALLDLHDDVGVLTVTTGFTVPGDDAQAARIAWKNRLKELRADADPDVRNALDARLTEYRVDIDNLFDPRANGQGRAIVLGLGSGERFSFSLQTPFEDRAVLRPRPYLRPLVAAIDEGRPAGIVIATKAGARVLEWTASETRALSDLTFELFDELLSEEGQGPASLSQRGAQVVNHRERFDDRVDANRDRFLKEVADVVAGHIAERGWDRVVVAGSSRIRDRVRELIDTERVTVHDVDEHWEDRSVGQIAAAVWPILRSTHGDREVALTTRIRDAALSGGPGALGVRRVAPAVNLGRVQHLAFSHDADVTGFVGPDGSLHAEVAGQSAQAGIELTPVTYFVERVVERVLATGGKVTRLDHEDAVRDLAAYQGVGALLRW